MTRRLCMLLSMCLASCASVVCVMRVADAEQAPRVITLRDALALTLENSPDLAIFSAEMRASEARFVQAGLRPNPEAALEVEDFAGSGAFSGMHEAQSTLKLSSLVELGGKRARRREAAEAARDLAGSEYEVRRVDVLAEATQRFIALVGAQEEQALSSETTASAEAALRIVRQRVEAGRTSLLEEKRAGVALARARVEEQGAQRDFLSARTRLAAMWGSLTATFDRVEAELFALEPVPAADSLVMWVSDNPEVERWEAERRLRESEIRRARAQGTPDATVDVGVRRLSGPEEHSFVAGLSLPLPLFDRNQGGVSESQELLAKAEAAQRAAEIRWRTTLLGLREELASASLEVETTRGEILPQAEEAVRIAEQGYREGRFSYLELADAQRTRLDVRRQLVADAIKYHMVVAEIERLTGHSLNP